MTSTAFWPAATSVTIGSSIVLGIEADANWARIDGSGSNAPDNPDLGTVGGCLQQLACDSRIQALGTLTARLGFTFDRALVYAKGGAAWANEKHHTGAKDPQFPDDPLSNYDATLSRTRWGWTIGAGLEYALARGWSGKVEYNYIYLGSIDATFTYSPAQTFAATASSQEILHTVKVGITYRFGD